MMLLLAPLVPLALVCADVPLLLLLLWRAFLSPDSADDKTATRRVDRGVAPVAAVLTVINACEVVCRQYVEPRTQLMALDPSVGCHWANHHATLGLYVALQLLPLTVNAFGYVYGKSAWERRYFSVPLALSAVMFVAECARLAAGAFNMFVPFPDAVTAAHFKEPVGLLTCSYVGTAGGLQWTVRAAVHSLVPTQFMSIVLCVLPLFFVKPAPLRNVNVWPLLLFFALRVVLLVVFSGSNEATSLWTACSPLLLAAYAVLPAIKSRFALGEPDEVKQFRQRDAYLQAAKKQ